MTSTKWRSVRVYITRTEYGRGNMLFRQTMMEGSSNEQLHRFLNVQFHRDREQSKAMSQPDVRNPDRNQGDHQTPELSMKRNLKSHI